MEDFILNSLGSMLLGALYFGYKLFRNRCRSKCTDGGLEVHIGFLKEEIDKKLDENKERLMEDLVDKLNHKLKEQLSPAHAGATVSPITEESEDSLSPEIDV